MVQRISHMITMQDNDNSLRVDWKSTSGDSALTPEPRQDSPNQLEDLPLPVPGGCGSKATRERCKKVRAEKMKGKKVSREKVKKKGYALECRGCLSQSRCIEDVLT